MFLKNFKLIFPAVLVFITMTAYAQAPLPQLGKASVKDIIKAMTLEEKALIVTGTGLRFAGNGPVIGEADGRVPGAAGNTMNINRFGIPGTVLSDGPAGLRIDPYHKGDSTKSYFATAWPVGTLLASSWDVALVKRVGAAFGNEIKEYGVDVILAPGMNIQRNPLNGRNFEYYSEDPLVSGSMAAALVNGIQSNGVGTSIKHFAANNMETNRNTVNAIISERALREIYLKGFEIAVKTSNPMTVMSSYNKINGTYTSENNDLLTKILREEWGFKGLVMTDWFGGHTPVDQMKAGNDLLEPGTKPQRQAIIDAVNNGTLDVKVLDKNVERVLNFVMRTPSFANYHYSNSPDMNAHATIARQAAAQGMILLKNQSAALPLQKNIKLALFGNGTYQTIIGGTGSGEVHNASQVTILQGLVDAGYSPWDKLDNKYSTYLIADLKAHPKKMLTLGAPRAIAEPAIEATEIEQAADKNDVAIYTISRNAGEGADRKVDDNFNLTDVEKQQIKAVADAFHAKNKKLVVIMNIGGAIETASWRDEADAILLAWQPGEEAGNAVADILSGKVNPSGKLAVSFPMSYDDEPSAKTFFGEPAGKPAQAIYNDGIYVGYRYFTSFGVKTAYPFGYGLSYTKFKYSNLTISSTAFKGKITAKFTITNTGSKAGKEVTELYLTAPKKTLDKPAEELKGFAKTVLLAPGDSQIITLTLNAADLASFNTGQSAWIADAGIYKIKIGASSEDIKLSKTFTLAKELVVEKTHKALVPQVAIDELKAK